MIYAASKGITSMQFAYDRFGKVLDGIIIYINWFYSEGDLYNFCKFTQ